MTWTYTGPSSSNKDAVRFHVQDTDSTRQLLTDEEIQYLLDEWMPTYDSVLYVAAMACEVLANRFAALIDVNADGVSVAQSQLAERFDTRAASLRDLYRAQNAIAGPYSPSSMGLEHDPDVAPLTFGTGMHDNLRAGQQDYGGRRARPARPLEEGV
jgi:hypothetical protein